jgi:tetratricopeptide (TPR) repeat protein
MGHDVDVLNDADAGHHHTLAESHWQAGRLRDAEAAARRAIELAPANAGYHHTLALALNEMGRLADAEAAACRATELDPSNTSYHHRLQTIRKERAGAVAGSDWADIRERLGRLAADERADDWGGNAWHLEPPLSTDELSELEEQLGVELPGEYRSFLLEAGAGGTGPGYGLLPVSRHDDGEWEWEGDGSQAANYGEVDEPFPHTEAFNPEDALPDEPQEADYGSKEAYQDAYDEWREERDEVVYAWEQVQGLVYLCHLGCGSYEALVVSGPARGQVWVDERIENCGFSPLIDADGTPLGFARWYRDWLDKAEAELSRQEE